MRTTRRFTFNHLVVSVVACSLLLLSCSGNKRINTDFLYFQKGLDSMGAAKLKDIIIQPNDLLTIQVFSGTLNQEQTTIFNIPNSGTGNTNPGYLVSTDGYIEIPVIGSIRAAGLTKFQLQNTLVDKLSFYVKSPAVIVRFAQFKVNVLGEVRSPGTKVFLTERITLMDAISASGDLTDQGKREDLLVIREENGKRNYYKVDLKNAKFFQSPVYQLQQNDLVYVGANINKLKSLNTNPTAQKDFQTFVTVLSVVTTIIFLVRSFIN